MRKPRTFVLLAFGSRRNWAPRDVVSFGWLKMACIVYAFCVAAAIASHAQGFTVLQSFAGYQTDGGAYPESSLIQATDGNFYGTTTNGGSAVCDNGCGAIFEVTPGGTLSMLYSFEDPNYGPSSGLIQATNGNFYGTTAGGGGSDNCYDTGGCGTVYEITAGGTLTTVYSFSETAAPSSGVIQSRDGNLYGTTFDGGAYEDGTIFELTMGGTLTTLGTFNGTDGAGTNILIQGSGGNFYGTTSYGGANGNGAIFELSASGVLTLLYSFCSQPNCSDGGRPSALIQASDGNLYGTTFFGGANGQGTIFELVPGGMPTTVYNFCGQKYCADGSGPTGLMQASDGNFLGTTFHGGTDVIAGGTIFEITAGGTLTTIYKFPASGSNYPDGANPSTGVMQAADGGFYGTTTYGGSSNCYQGCGTIFTFGPTTGDLSPTSLNFWDQALDETSAAKTVMLKNSGLPLLTVSDVAINGNFAIFANTCTGSTLAEGKTCTVSLTFTPTVLGEQTGTLSFTDNTRNSPQTVAVSGTGVEPATLHPSSANYGDQAVGTTSAAKIFTLTNDQTVTLSNIAISTTGDFAVSATTCSTSLAAKEKCTISVTFSPTQTGTRTGQLSVSDSASNSPQTSSLQGTGK